LASGRCMANNFQMVRKGRPGLWFQPEALPKSALEQLARQPTASLAEDAGPTSMYPKGVRRWPKQTPRRQSQVGGIFGSGTIGQYPEGGNRQHQPVAGYPLWIGTPGMLPLPAHSLESAEPQFNPDPQPIPTHSHIPRRQVGQYQPGFLLVRAPDYQQGTTTAYFWLSESCTLTHPGIAGSRNQTGCRLPTASQGLKGSVAFDSHQGVPTQGCNPPPEAGTPQTSIGQYQHRHGLGNCWPQQLQQVHNRQYPRAFFIGRQDVPSHRNGVTPVEHTNHQSAYPVPVQSGVNGQAKWLPCHQDKSQRSKGPKQRDTST
jgi:hypothetical protein